MSLIDEELLPGEREEEAKKQCVLVTVSEKSSSKFNSSNLNFFLKISEKNNFRREKREFDDSSFAAGSAAADLRRVRRLQNGANQKHHDREDEKGERAATRAQLRDQRAALQTCWNSAFQNYDRNADARKMRNRKN